MGRTHPHAGPDDDVTTDSTWGPGAARRATLRLFDSPRTTYCVLSSSERCSFPTAWGVDPDRVAFTPFYWTLPTAPQLVLGGSGIFSGGDSLRDYATLLTAAEHVVAPVTVASAQSPPVRVPPAVTMGAVTPQRFLELMQDSAVVVVPLRARLVRSAGQQTYLNAMALGKLVVVSDAPGVRDHVEHGRTGLVVPSGDPEGLADALRWATDPANADVCARMRTDAHTAAIKDFGPDRYVDRLLELIDDGPPA